jgi:hypothetical protein
MRSRHRPARAFDLGGVEAQERAIGDEALALRPTRR